MATHKKARQLRRRSILMYGEGQTDQAFLRYLRSQYCSRDCRKAITFDDAHGGGADGAAKKALQTYESMIYDDKLILLDGDTQLSAIWKSKLVNNKWVIVIPQPCIEGLFLDVLDPQHAHSTWPTDRCKSVFHKCYLTKSEAMDYREYQNVFIKRKIEDVSKKIKEIASLLLTLHH